MAENRGRDSQGVNTGVDEEWSLVGQTKHRKNRKATLQYSR
jgi:hypothetical protein